MADHVVSAEQTAREEELVRTVLASFEGAASPRLRELLQSLTRHLHQVVRETRLTTAEWEQAVAFLTDCGRISDDRRQELILLSDVLGLSMQTIAVNNEAHGDATEATVFGPFFVEDSPAIGLGGDLAGGAAGEPCWVEGTVRDTDGRPVAGARIEAREADADGRYAFWAVTPTPYPIPYDGPVGRLLEAAGRSPVRASHLHVMVTAPGLHTLVTHMFVAGCEHLGADSVFGVKESLVRDFARQDPGTPTPDGRTVDGSWTRTRFDVVLAPERGG